MSRTAHADERREQCQSPLREVRPPPGEDELFTRCRAGDDDAREQLVERSTPLAIRLARRYRHAGEPLDDLEQVALIGLIKAVDGFDPGRQASFRSYAMPVILGEIRHHFRDHTWVLHVPSHMRELTQRVSRATAMLSVQLGREPSVLEIAELIGASDDEVLDAREASAARRTLSFGAACGTAGNNSDADAMTLGDLIVAHEEGYARAEDRAMVDALLRTLSTRQRLVLCLRFDHDLTQTQIASAVGISQMHVSRVIREALTRMRAIDQDASNRGRRLPIPPLQPG